MTSRQVETDAIPQIIIEKATFASPTSTVWPSPGRVTGAENLYGKRPARIRNVRVVLFPV
jgi:hypothetical protein